MLSTNRSAQGNRTWSVEEWTTREASVRARALAARSEAAAWRVCVKHARTVMRAYSTSFFIVSRFLPAHKRAEVEAVYAAVRYPDEIVDTFPLAAAERLALLDEWSDFYETALACASLREALLRGVPTPLACFTKVVRERAIPPEHYRDFLRAMRRDTSPLPFETFDDLVENYIYGSAVVVGYFLTHVYGSIDEQNFSRALVAACDLGIALQLTNFLRDVNEDRKRGRLYLPLEFLRAEGIENFDARDERQHASLRRVLRRLSSLSQRHYRKALDNIDAFAPDCRAAIDACIKVYSRLNERIAYSRRGIDERESVPTADKLRALPVSKYWRIPLAYLLG
ncbi:MAG TPA: phytoene/squalene synthase family protein [Pyrinomonadaceae bacterium]|jgi:phytoene synthase